MVDISNPHPTPNNDTPKQGKQNSLPHLVIIDGLSFFFRAYHGVRPLTRSDGLHTNALYGFAQMLIKVMRDLEPDFCCVALDSIGPTFRHEMYPEYKANRKEPDPEMLEQFPYFEPMIKAFGIPGLRLNGVEADDIIATLVATHRHNFEITIVSSDKDLMQLLGGNVLMLDTMKNRVIDEEVVHEKFGVTPDKVTQVQALIGDSADNIPGVPSVGPKTAAKLMAAYGDLAGLYAHVHEVKQEKLRQKLIEHKESAFLSEKLATLKQDVELNGEGIDEKLIFKPTAAAARDFLLDLEFKTLANRLTDAHLTNGRVLESMAPQGGVPEGIANNAGAEQPKEFGRAYTCIQTEEELKKWCKKLEEAPVFSFDTETTALDVFTAELVGISLATEAGAACYIPLGHKGDLFEEPKQLSKKYVIEALKPFFADQNKQKIAHNVKYDWHILKKEGLTISNHQDTMLMSFALHGGLHNHGLDTLCKLYLGVEPIPFKEVCGTGKAQITFDKADLNKATEYAAEDADLTLQLYQLFWPKLQKEKGPKYIYEQVENPLIPIVAVMEERGVCVDQQELVALSANFEERLKVCEKEVFALAGEEFNINSPKQLGEILFEKLGLKGGKRTKTGYSTNEAALTKLADAGHQIAEKVLAYRSLSKLRSTYTEALQEDIHPDGRVHTSYHQAGASTGRFSSSDPNLQNIPIRSEDGRKIRHAFVAAKNHMLVSADYSQIELRLLAHMAQIPNLIEAFCKGADIHAHTASKMFNCLPAEVTPDQRSAAKVINFGIVYGMGPFALAKNLGIDNKTAKDYIENYLNRYEGIRTFIDGTIAFAKENGYVQTYFGRRIHTPNINDKNRAFAAGAERAAINAPLQGSNADIIKLVMQKLEAYFTTGPGQHLGVKMLMQVHDELIFEIPEKTLEEACAKIKELMEGAIKLDVPLTVGLGYGRTWEEAH